MLRWAHHINSTDALESVGLNLDQAFEYNTS